jgi:hypothetical protein
LVWDTQFQRLSQQAMLAVGRLDARVHDLLQRNPMLSVNRARELLGNEPAFSTLSAAFGRLADLGVVEEKPAPPAAASSPTKTTCASLTKAPSSRREPRRRRPRPPTRDLGFRL